jgi:hypothetical protein
LSRIAPPLQNSETTSGEVIGNRFFRVFWVAGVVDAVKANFVPISEDTKAGTTAVPHRGGRLEVDLAVNWTSGALS